MTNPEKRQSYELLMQCRRSGQVSDAAWAEHLADEVFLRWLASRFPGWV